MKLKRYLKLISKYYDGSFKKDATASEIALVEAIVTAQAAPSSPTEDVLEKMVAYGDARVKEAKKS